ncbi:MAG TPA: AfsR/SARP family transcriptional regulator [Micromonosporaceae bacterium]|nr:AfsR/SARP family transcriptional regulator [Micromonosporaceae bacterium]
MLHFQVLGPLEVLDGDRVCTPSPPKVSRVLALLLLRANQVVSMDSLIEELWGEEPPTSAIGTAQTYIYQLRKILDPRGEVSAASEWLVTKAPGYLMRVSPNQLDATTFEALSWQGRQMLERGQPEQAAQLLRRALDLWRGPSLANVRRGHLLEAHAVHLEEQRMRTLELRIQADAELGRHRELIGEMRSLVASHPLNEWFHGQLIVALSRSGRRGEALQAYQDLRRVLSSQLGLDPQPELQRLHREVLSHGRPTMSEFAPYQRLSSAA